MIKMSAWQSSLLNKLSQAFALGRVRKNYVKSVPQTGIASLVLLIAGKFGAVLFFSHLENMKA